MIKTYQIDNNHIIFNKIVSHIFSLTYYGKILSEFIIFYAYNVCGELQKYLNLSSCTYAHKKMYVKCTSYNYIKKLNNNYLLNVFYRYT